MIKTPVQVHIPYKMLLERKGEIVSMGINPEIYIDGEELDDAKEKDLHEIAEAFGKAGLSITQHGPYVDLNPASPDEDTRLLTVKRYRHAFRAAAILRPKIIVLHPGYSEKKFKGDIGAWLAQGLKTWPEFIKEAQRLNVTIAAENVFDKDPTALKTLVETVGSRFFKVCLDTGHINAFADADMEGYPPFEEWVKAFGPDIAEVHLHDNSGNADEHLPLGEGSIDFNRFFTLLKDYAKDPVYTIEPHGEEELKRAVVAIRKFI